MKDKLTSLLGKRIAVVDHRASIVGQLDINQGAPVPPGLARPQVDGFRVTISGASVLFNSGDVAHVIESGSLPVLILKA